MSPSRLWGMSGQERKGGRKGKRDGTMRLLSAAGAAETRKAPGSSQDVTTQGIKRGLAD